MIFLCFLTQNQRKLLQPTSPSVQENSQWTRFEILAHASKYDLNLSVF